MYRSARSPSINSILTRRHLLKSHLLGALSASVLPAAAMLPHRAWAQEPVVKVMALGQAFLASDLREPAYPEFARVADLLHQCDACALELITVRPLQASAAASVALVRAADPAGLDGLKALGVTMLALANGSSVDVNGGGLADLIAAAHARDLTFAGAGSDLAGANAAGYRTSAAGKVALIAAASGEIRTGVAAGDTRPGINVIPRLPNGQLEPLEIERFASQVHAGAENANVAIVYLQHEAERESAAREGRPRIEWLQRVARRAIESGAGLVVCAGLPQLQGIEIYRNRPIFYGLGSLVLQLPGELEPEALQAVAARCTFAGDSLRQIELIPIQLTAESPGAAGDAQAATRGRPTLPDAAAGAVILARVAELSRPHNTSVAVADGIGRIAL